MIAIELLSPTEILTQLAQRCRTQRLERRLTQQGLADRSGVALGTLKRFERSGHASLETVVKLAIALDCIGPFDALFAPSAIRSLDEVLEQKTTPQRGSRS